MHPAFTFPKAIPIHCVLLLCVIAAGCGRDAGGSGPISSGTPSNDTVRTAFVRPVVPTPLVSKATHLAVARRITGPLMVQGVGPLHPGMSLAHAVRAMDGDFWTRDHSLTCSYFQSARAPGMRFLFLNRRLARIEVNAGAMATVDGVKIGATEDEVQAAYPGRVTLTTDRFTDAHYLTVTPSDPDDSAFRMVFETDGNRVTRFRTGIRFAVEWVDGCR